MVDMLSFFLAFASPPDMAGPVAVHAAYVLHTRAEDDGRCCGRCTNGKIIHGDGHTTDCPCPPGCECKAVRHPPVILAPCKDGKCSPKK